MVPPLCGCLLVGQLLPTDRRFAAARAKSGNRTISKSQLNTILFPLFVNQNFIFHFLPTLTP
jgi:hypothetical protein